MSVQRRASKRADGSTQGAWRGRRGGGGRRRWRAGCLKRDCERVGAGLVRKTQVPRGAEVRPLAPSTIEAMRAAATTRDAVLLAVLAYAGLRPGEALALRWGDVRERTLLVERALSLGAEKGTKTGR